MITVYLVILPKIILCIAHIVFTTSFCQTATGEQEVVFHIEAVMRPLFASDPCRADNVSAARRRDISGTFGIIPRIYFRLQNFKARFHQNLHILACDNSDGMSAAPSSNSARKFAALVGDRGCRLLRTRHLSFELRMLAPFAFCCNPDAVHHRMGLARFFRASLEARVSNAKIIC